MLRDIEHLSTRLGKIEGFGDLSEYLVKIVKSKDVRPSTPPPPASSPSAEEGNVEEKEGEQAEAKIEELERQEKSPSPEDPVEKEEMGNGKEEKGA